MRRPVDGVGCAADLYCRDKLLTMVAQPEGKLTLTEQHMDSWESRPLFTGSDDPEDWETLVRILVEAANTGPPSNPAPESARPTDSSIPRGASTRCPMRSSSGRWKRCSAAG